MANKYEEAVIQKPTEKERIYPIYRSELEIFQREQSVDPEFFSINLL